MSSQRNEQTEFRSLAPIGRSTWTFKWVGPEGCGPEADICFEYKTSSVMVRIYSKDRQFTNRVLALYCLATDAL